MSNYVEPIVDVTDYTAKLARLRAARSEQAAPSPVRESEGPAELGTFATYVPDFVLGISDAAERLNSLYESITIWEIYKRLLPNKPHALYHPTKDFSVACPHEEGRRSLSMWINDAKGLYFCAHTWEGNNKMALYCEIRGLHNKPELFHGLKQLMVWEFRRENPYAGVRM